MLEYFSDNQAVITSVTSTATLLVWIFYAQLLFNSYRRQRHPRVLINKGLGDRYIDSPCLICNMSQEPVYLYFMMVRLKTSDGIFTVPMTDREGDELPDNEGDLTLRNRTRQGPLHSGECLEFVTFRRMIHKLLRIAGVDIQDGIPLTADVQLQWLEVHVVCIYGPEHKPFGAVRRFLIDTEENETKIRLYPETLETKTKRSMRYRRQIENWLKTDH